MRHLRWLAIVPALLFVWLVWPTPYRYFEHAGDGHEIVRVSRVTGGAEALINGVWYPAWGRQ